MSPDCCPLCGAPACLKKEDRSWPGTIRYWCQAHCDTFRLGTVFQRYLGIALQNKEKQAIAAYLHATKGLRRSAPLIQWDNYKAYVRKGRKLQQSATTGPQAVTK